jgi:Tol biopolymer transport system component
MVFIADATGNGDIRTRNTGSGALGQETTSTHAEMFPQFSVDGKKLLFTRKKGNTEDVFEMVVGSSTETPVVGGGGDQTRPGYAEGGRVVYFDGARGEGLWDLAVVEGAGGERRYIAKGVRLPLRARPALSPDGKWVAYAYDDPSKAKTVYLSRVDGSKTVEVATTFEACGEPAIAQQGDRTVLAYTALPNKGADWRFLYVTEVTSKL